jgi:uncharacterized membrane protein
VAVLAARAEHVAPPRLTPAAPRVHTVSAGSRRVSRGTSLRTPSTGRQIVDATVRSEFDDTSNSSNMKIARALGLFSLGLGVWQLASPRSHAKVVGIDDAPDENVIRAIGLRELGAAAGLLWGSQPAPFLWSRVAGDLMDLSMLANAMGSRDGERRRQIARSMLAVAAITLPDVVASLKTTEHMPSLSRSSDDGSADVRTSITVRASADEVYRVWSDLGGLPRFMTHLESVTDLGGGRSRWVATGPAGTSVEWEAETTEEVPGSRLSWRSVEGSDVDNSGTVELVPATQNRGTEVRLRLSYAPPGGTVGRVAAKLLGEEPKQQVSDDLRRFKQLVETGDITRSEASPEGIRSTRVLRQRPGQPLAA